MARSGSSLVVLSLARRDQLRLGAQGTLGRLAAHAQVLLLRTETTGGDRRVVHEHVRATAVRCDESEALVGVEPLDGAFCHFLSFLGASPERRLADRGCNDGLWLTSAKTIPGEAKTPAVTSAGVQERTQYVRGNYDCNAFHVIGSPY